MPGPSAVQALSTVRAAASRGLGEAGALFTQVGQALLHHFRKEVAHSLAALLGVVDGIPPANMVFKYWHENLEMKYIHSTHLISIALLQLAPVSLLPGTDTDPTGHHIRHKTSSLSLCNRHTGIHRGKKPQTNNYHYDKTGNYFSFNNKILCRWCCHHLWRKGEKHSPHCG